MDRIDLENWFAHHPQSILSNPDELLDECEAVVRGRARRDAWMHARDIAEESLNRFERGFGFPASETFVTREVCHEVARELKHHEPHPDGSETDELARKLHLDELDPEVRMMMRRWMSDLAEVEEHVAWREIVRFTDHAARSLIREARMTNQLVWSFDRSYPRLAARAVRMLIEELEAHAANEMADSLIGTSEH